MPVVAGMCLYCVKKLFNTLNVILKKYWNKNEKHFKKRTKSRDAAAKKEQIQEE